MSEEYNVQRMIDSEYKKLEGITDRLEVLHEMNDRGLEVFTSWERMTTKNLKGVRDRLDPNLYPDPDPFRNEKTVAKFLEDFIEKNQEEAQPSHLVEYDKLPYYGYVFDKEN